MAESSTIKERLVALRQKRLKSLIKNLIFISIFSTILGIAFIWLQMKYVFMFTLIALMPMLISIVWDKKPGRFASKTVAAFNITGMFPSIIALVSTGSPNSTAMAILNNPNTWLLIYGFAIFGWIVVFMIPKITLIFLEIRSKYLIRRMERFQQDLLEEWGEDVRR